MCMAYYSVGANFTYDTTGIFKYGGHWHCTGLDNDYYRDHADSARFGTSANENLDMFIKELIELTEHFVYPQMIFRTAQDITDFQQLADPRLDELQKYVARVRQTKNILVCTAEEVRQLVRTPGPTPIKDWYWELMDVKVQLDDRTLPPLEFLAAPKFCEITRGEYDEIGSKNIEFLLNRYLHLSNTVITSIIGSPHDGIRVEAGERIYDKLRHTTPTELDAVVFIPESPWDHPRVCLDLTHLNAVNQGGIAVPIEEIHILPVFPSTFNEFHRIMPLDLSVAGELP